MRHNFHKAFDVAFYAWILLGTTDCSEISYVADSGITEQDINVFLSEVSRIKESILVSWQESLTFAEMGFSFLMASNTFPDRSEFDSFAATKYWDPKKTINGLQWVPEILNSERAAFESSVQQQVPNFMIFSYDAAGNSSVPVRKPPNSSSIYYPILYCYPPADFILGLDLNDNVEGPSIDLARATGEPASAAPFLLRGLGPSTPFPMGMTLYMPAYRSGNGSAVTYVQGSRYAGCLVAVFLFRSMIAGILVGLELQNYDVFLFYINPSANATDDAAAAAAATYVAHFESAPAATAPGLSPAAALLLRPGDVGGDIVTGFAPALDVPMAGRTFRVSVRARAGSLPRDVLLYGGRRGPPGRPPPTHTHTLGSSLRARAGAGPPGQEPGRHARGLQPERLAAGRLGCCIRVRAALLRMRAAPAARSPPCSESEGSVPVFFEIFYLIIGIFCPNRLHILFCVPLFRVRIRARSGRFSGPRRGGFFSRMRFF